MIVSPYYVLLSIEKPSIVLWNPGLVKNQALHGRFAGTLSKHLLHLGSTARIVQRFCKRLHQPRAGSPLTASRIWRSD